VLDVGFDALDEFFEAGDIALGNGSEPELNLIEPRRIGPGEMDMTTRPGDVMLFPHVREIPAPGILGFYPR
jgi:hypothetical protein